MIHGVASTPRITANKTVHLSRGCVSKLPIPLLWGHSKYEKKIGEVVYLRKTTDQIYVRAIIDQNEAATHAWRFIESGEVRNFSIGAKSSLQAEVDGVRFFDRWHLHEVSICRTPANAECWFEIYAG